MSNQDKVEEGDKVTWDWNGSTPGGKVAEVKAGEVTVTSHRGNEIKKTGDKDDPAVHIARSGNDVVKLASELDVEEKGNDGNDKAADKEDTEGDEAAEDDNKTTERSNAEEKKEVKEDDEAEDNEAEKDEDKTGDNDNEGEEDESKAGEKRKADEKAEGEDAKKDEEEEKEEEPDAKKQKTTDNAKTGDENGNGTEKKKPGRPKGAAKKEKAPPATGRAKRQTRSQGKADAEPEES